MQKSEAVRNPLNLDQNTIVSRYFQGYSTHHLVRDVQYSIHCPYLTAYFYVRAIIKRGEQNAPTQNH